MVDGGVCDNQGITSLLEQDCTVILVSDGSGQMSSENNSGQGLLSVPLRSNKILQAHIREAQYQDLVKRRRSSLLRGLMFIHLTEELNTTLVNWIGCREPIQTEESSFLTNYGIPKEIQQLLSTIRTDLDSFPEAEAYALMFSAYRMTEKAFEKKCVDVFSAPP